MKNLRPILAVAAALSLAFLPAQGVRAELPKITDVFAFGDSLSDGGNPDEWLFLDPAHPTARTHEILAPGFRRVLIREPGTLAMFGLGLLALGVVRSLAAIRAERRRRHAHRNRAPSHRSGVRDDRLRNRSTSVRRSRSRANAASGMAQTSADRARSRSRAPRSPVWLRSALNQPRGSTAGTPKVAAYPLATARPGSERHALTSAPRCAAFRAG